MKQLLSQAVVRAHEIDFHSNQVCVFCLDRQTAEELARMEYWRWYYYVYLPYCRYYHWFQRCYCFKCYRQYHRRWVRWYSRS